MPLYQDDCTSELTQISLSDPAFWVAEPSALTALLKYLVLRPNLELQTLKEMAMLEIPPCVQSGICLFAPLWSLASARTQRHSAPLLSAWSILPQLKIIQKILSYWLFQTPVPKILIWLTGQKTYVLSKLFTPMRGAERVVASTDCKDLYLRSLHSCGTSGKTISIDII